MTPEERQRYFAHPRWFYIVVTATIGLRTNSIKSCYVALNGR